MTKKGRPKGYRLSAETRNKIGEAMTGRKISDETREKISKGLKVYFKTPSGRIQRAELGINMMIKWARFMETEAYEEYRKEFSDLAGRMCTEMHRQAGQGAEECG